MKFIKNSTPARLRLPILITFVLVLQSGCEREEVKAYRVPKETQAPTTVAADKTSPPAVPQIKYAVPPGWEEKAASGMRVANFRIAGKGEQEAEASVLVLPSRAAENQEVINIFRQQMRLAPLSQEELTAETGKVAIGSNQGKLFEMTGGETVVEGKGKAILLAALVRDNLAWFFKLSGEDSLVSQQKTAFLEFLKSISFAEGSAMAMASHPRQEARANKTEVSRPGENLPAWTIPPGWQEQPASAMLLKSFLITGNNGGKATVTVGVSPGSFGGPLLNVNRWRDQLSLAPIEESELPKLTSSLDVMGGKAMLVEISGTDKKNKQNAGMIAAMVSRENKTWVYKLMGDEEVVAREKDTFIKFVQTIRYPNV